MSSHLSNDNREPAEWPRRITYNQSLETRLTRRTPHIFFPNHKYEPVWMIRPLSIISLIGSDDVRTLRIRLHNELTEPQHQRFAERFAGLPADAVTGVLNLIAASMYDIERRTGAWFTSGTYFEAVNLIPFNTLVDMRMFPDGAFYSFLDHFAPIHRRTLCEAHWLTLLANAVPEWRP